MPRSPPDWRVVRIAVMVASALVLACRPTAAHELDELVNTILLGSPNDRLGLVTIVDPQSCVVRLENRRSAAFSIFRFSEVKADDVAVVGSGTRTFLQIGGNPGFVEVHSGEGGAVLKAEQAQITTSNPDQDVKSVAMLVDQFCPGEPIS